MSTMDEFIAQNYAGYDPRGGVTTTMGGGVDANGRRMPTVTHTKRTPETHPWLFINPGEVDVNGRIYGEGTTRTDTGYTAGRQASDAERQASYAKNNFFTNGQKGMDPRLMAGMNRTNPRSNQFTNQYGTYTRQHAYNDPARAAAGLDPWTEARSTFQGKDQQGAPINYSNQTSLWGNRGPGFQGGPHTALANALRNPTGGGTPPPSTQPPPGSLPGGGTLPGNGTLPGAGSQIGLPPGHDQFGGGGNKVPPSTPQWWQEMMARRPGAQ